MSKGKRVLLIALYIAQWPITYAGSLAYLQQEFPQLAGRRCREDVATATFDATWPVGWLVIPFLTGFDQDGLQFTCTREQRQ